MSEEQYSMKKYSVGDIIEGKVTGIENYGIFLLIDDDITGLIHISELSDDFVRNVSDYANLNEIIKARVLEYDEKNKKMKLCVKNLDYRDEENRKTGIVETKTGFGKLSTELEKWVQKWNGKTVEKK